MQVTVYQFENGFTAGLKKADLNGLQIVVKRFVEAILLKAIGSRFRKAIIVRAVKGNGGPVQRRRI
jgi:hypothetical protein